MYEGSRPTGGSSGALTAPRRAPTPWRTSGPAPAGSGARSLAEFAGRIYFAADDGRGGSLWRTDGTAAGTVRVKATGFLPAGLLKLGKRLVFLAFTPSRGHDLWVSDGTAKGTAPISDIVPGPGSPGFRDFVVHGSRLYFVAEDKCKGQELWVTDGTARGTRRLTNLPRKQAFFADSEGLVLYLPRISPGSSFVFAAHDGAHGVEPWVTDGTAKGTRLLRDLCPGPCSGLRFVWFESLPGLLFFSGTNGVRGDEAWVTDGTATGRASSGTSAAGAAAPSPSASPPWEAACSSRRTTGSPGTRSGSPTARPPGPSASADSL